MTNLKQHKNLLNRGFYSSNDSFNMAERFFYQRLVTLAVTSTQTRTHQHIEALKNVMIVRQNWCVDRMKNDCVNAPTKLWPTERMNAFYNWYEMNA